MTFTRRRFEFVIMSFLYRDTFDEMKRDYSINLVVIDKTSTLE